MNAAGVPAKTRWGAIVAVAMSVVLVALDMTIVAVTLPEMGAVFGVGAATTQWIVLAYMLPLAALSIPVGRWLDGAGPLPAFLLAVGGFGVTSVLVAVAVNLPMVLAARVLQGAFGALVGVVGMPIVGAAARPEHRARAMSIVLTLIPLAGVVGPALGGVLAAEFGWRSIFLINVPIVAVAVYLGMRSVPRTSAAGAGLPLPNRSMVVEALALGTASAALFLSIDGITNAGERGYAVPVAMGVVAALALVWWSRLDASQTVRGLLRLRRLALPLLALPMITATVGGLNFLVPYLLADVTGGGPKVAGFTLLALAGGMALFSPPAGVLADRYGNGPVTFTGAVVVLAGLASLLLLDGDPAPADVAWRLAIVGLGNGLFAGPNAAAILAAIRPQQAGAASGLASLVRTLGFALGPALGALAWTTAGSAGAGFAAGVVILAAGAGVAVLVTGTRWPIVHRAGAR